jgi:hypothetical protein
MLGHTGPRVRVLVPTPKEAGAVGPMQAGKKGGQMEVLSAPRAHGMPIEGESIGLPMRTILVWGHSVRQRPARSGRGCPSLTTGLEVPAPAGGEGNIG